MRRPIPKQSAVLQVKAFLRALKGRLMVKFGPTGVEVDVKDDSIDRWCVSHYRYDLERKQVRHVFLKAFSNEKAMMKFLHRENVALQARKRMENVPDHEHLSGGHYEPGHHARVREQRARNGGIGSNISWYEPWKSHRGKGA